jgi:hypothetical protein
MQSAYSNNYGLNNSYEYYEYVFDSSTAQRSFDRLNTKENWPMFFIGGKQPLTNVAAVKVLEVQIPASYYVVTDNGTFTYTDNLGTIVMPQAISPGLYTSATLATKLQQSLNAAHVTLGGNPLAFTVTYQTNTLKFFISGVDTVTGPFQYSLTWGPGTAHDVVGMKEGTTQSDPVGALLTYALNITGPPYLYLNSQTIGTLVDLFLPKDVGVSGNAGPQIAKIPVTTNPGGTIYWQDPDPQKWFNVENLISLQQIDFYLTLGTSTKILDLNGLPFSLKLGVLLSSTAKSDVGSGLTESRVLKRIRPT